FFLYRMFLLIRGTQAVQLMFGVLLLALIGLLANLLDLRLLSWIFRNAAPAILIGIIVLFQPEIRRALDQFGRIGFIGRPLAEEGTVRERMGTRHRAGLGLSMQTDAVVLILSEELGQIAVAHEGKLLRNLDPDRLRQVLTSLLQPRTELHRPPLPVWRREDRAR